MIEGSPRYVLREHWYAKSRNEPMAWNCTAINKGNLYCLGKRQCRKGGASCGDFKEGTETGKKQRRKREQYQKVCQYGKQNDIAAHFCEDRKGLFNGSVQKEEGKGERRTGRRIFPGIVRRRMLRNSIPWSCKHSGQYRGKDYDEKNKIA